MAAEWGGAPFHAIPSEAFVVQLPFVTSKREVPEVLTVAQQEMGASGLGFHSNPPATNPYAGL